MVAQRRVIDASAFHDVAYRLTMSCLLATVVATSA